MPDIQLRFHRDMLVLSSPVDEMLARQGIDVARDRQYLNLMEPDGIRDALRMEVLAGAQCLVTTTEDITRARLAHLRMDGDSSKLAKAAVDIAREAAPQHILAEIGPCGLPLDPSSKASLNENRAQYADAARAFADLSIDALFLNKFSSIADMKCALMGVAQVSGLPVFASMVVGEAGLAPEAPAPAAQSTAPAQAASDDPLMGPSAFIGYEALEVPGMAPSPIDTAFLHAELWPEALDAMVDLGADVVGFETAEPLDHAVAYARAAAEKTDAPLLAQLRVTGDPQSRPNALVPLDQVKEYLPDTMERAALALFKEGVQFLRATGRATPAFTGALAATMLGVDVRQR